MNKLIFGRYIPGDSFIHRLDPRAKLLASFYFIGIIFLANNWQSYVLIAAFTAFAISLSKISARFFIRGVRPLLWLILFTVALQTLFTQGGEAVVKFPVHEVSLMLSIALRFVPTLMDETEKIMNAQRARGVDFGEGNLLQKMKAIVPLLIPLFVSSFNRAEDLATAMEARGYQGGEGRTKYRILHWHLRDTIVMFGFVLLTIGLFVLRT